MAFTGITATEAEIDQKLGENVTSAFTDTMKTQALLMAESVLNVMTRKNWSDDFAGLNVDVKSIVTDATTAFVAIEGIRFNMEEFIPTSVADAMITNLREAFVRDVGILRDIKSQEFTDAA